MLVDRPTWELFDRRTDRAETTDVLDEQPEVVRELRERVGCWLAQELRGREDPLRLAAEASFAPEMVRRRLEERRGSTANPWPP
jgi:hypothetical protein